MNRYNLIFKNITKQSRNKIISIFSSCIKSEKDLINLYEYAKNKIYKGDNLLFEFGVSSLVAMTEYDFVLPFLFSHEDVDINECFKYLLSNKMDGHTYINLFYDYPWMKEGNAPKLSKTYKRLLTRLEEYDVTFFNELVNGLPINEKVCIARQIINIYFNESYIYRMSLKEEDIFVSYINIDGLIELFKTR